MQEWNYYFDGMYLLCFKLILSPKVYHGDGWICLARSHQSSFFYCHDCSPFVGGFPAFFKQSFLPQNHVFSCAFFKSVYAPMQFFNKFCFVLQNRLHLENVQVSCTNCFQSLSDSRIGWSHMKMWSQHISHPSLFSTLWQLWCSVVKMHLGHNIAKRSFFLVITLFTTLSKSTLS